MKSANSGLAASPGTLVKIGSMFGVGFLVLGAVMSILLDLSVGPRQPFIATSPDGTRRVIVTQRPRLFGGIDPSADVTVVLESTSSGEVIDRVGVVVDEDSDVGTPSVTWHTEAAVVTNLEKAHRVTATLRWSESRR